MQGFEDGAGGDVFAGGGGGVGFVCAKRGGRRVSEEGIGGGRREGGQLLRLSEVVYEDCSAFAESEDGVFVERGVGGEDAFGETLDHGAGEGEVLVGRISLGLRLSLHVGLRIVEVGREIDSSNWSGRGIPRCWSLRVL